MRTIPTIMSNFLNAGLNITSIRMSDKTKKELMASWDCKTAHDTGDDNILQTKYGDGCVGVIDGIPIYLSEDEELVFSLSKMPTGIVIA